MRSRSRVALIISIIGLGVFLLAACQYTSPNYRVVKNLKRLPEEVRFWAEAYSRIFVGTSMTDDKYTYVLVSTGPAANPKQTLNILDIKEEDDAIYVEVDLASEINGVPPVGEQYNYPFAVARLPKTTLPVKFRSTVNSELWIPQVVGTPEGWLPFWGPEGQSVYHERRPQIALGAMPTEPNVFRNDGPFLVIEGIARVFEATVEQDWLANGTPYGHSFTMASSGAPNWGFFRFELDERYSNEATLRIYSTSAKDGSIENLVTISE